MVSTFILQNFALVCIAIVMAILLIQNIRTQRFLSVTMLLIVAMTVALSGLLVMEDINVRGGNIVAATWATFLGYAIRPFCLYCFLLIAHKKFDRLAKWLLIPLFLNVLLYATSVFLNVEPMARLTFYYTVAESGTGIVHHRGVMNFTAHILSLLYLLLLLYLSVRKLKGKHRYDALSVLICASFIVAAVIIEMTGLAMGVLNIGIAIGVVFYYLFVLKEENRRDALTGLFDRKTFYSDLKRFAKDVHGVFAVDMNGLKYINDSQGHQAGDTALRAVAKAIEDNAGPNMYLYRMGGDEFTGLIVGTRKLDLEAIAKKIHGDLKELGYAVSIGYATDENGVTDVEEMARIADQAMYDDKAAFYKEHPRMDRRGSNRQ